MIRFYAEPTSAERKTWAVYVVGEGVVVERVKADDAATAIERARKRIKKVAIEIYEQEQYSKKG